MGNESLKRTTDATVEPISLVDMKAHLRLEPSDDAENGLITAQITAARQMVEKHLSRALITQSWTLVMDRSPSRFALDYPPLQTVTSIKSRTDDDVATTNSADGYTVIASTEPGEVILKPGASWADHRSWSGFEVIYVAGYGNASTDVPDAIIEAIKLTVTQMYMNRGDDISIGLSADVRNLIGAYRAY